jgi:integrase
MRQERNPSQKGREVRHETRHRGISYRVNADGTRTYSVYYEPNRKLGKSPYVLAGTTEQQALARQAELRHKKARGERVILPSKRTVREVGEEWFEAESPGWKGDYRREMRRLLDREIYEEFGDDPVASIGPRDLIAFDRDLLARGLSESGAANVQKPLRGLLDHAVLAEDTPVNPYRQIPRGKVSSCNTKREHHEWTTEEVERFIRTAHEFDEREHARRAYGDQVELMVRCGLRLAEASGLRFSDIDRDSGVLHVRRQFTKRGQVVEYTKTKAGRRRVPLTEEHVRAWNRVVAETGLKLAEGVKVTPHSARHACASQLADLDLDSDDAAALLGHTSAKVTEGIYVHAFNRDAREQRIREAMRAAQNGGQS